MNADSYLLLTTVLADQPCMDATLQQTVETASFASQGIAQQCYYVIYLYSCVKAQLTDLASAYNTLVQFTAVQQQIKLEEQLGRTVSQPPPRLTWPLALPPPAPTNNLELRLVIVGGGAVARCLLYRLMRDTSNEVSAAGPAAGSSTDVVVHPSRITVLTRQPDTLGEFARKGVRCLHFSRGRQALATGDVVVLACQPHHLPDLARTLFSPAAPSNADEKGGAFARGAVKLKDTALVFSALGAVPRSKVAATIGHDEQLIVRARIDAPSQLPPVAASHQAMAQACAEQQVRYMADHDSFLRAAVDEAEQLTISRLAEKMAATTDSGAVYSEELALKVARRAATQAATEKRFLPPSKASLLLQETQPEWEFFAAVWVAMQRSAGAVMLDMAAAEERRGDKASAKSRAVRQPKSDDRRRKYGKGKRASGDATAGGAGDDRMAGLDGQLIQLCAALASLAESGRQLVSVATLSRYGVLPASCGLNSPGWAASHSTTSSVNSLPQGDAAAEPEAPPQRPADERAVTVPFAFKRNAETFWAEVLQQYRTVVAHC